MGAGVSDWRLARAVSQTGQLGVVSGTALATILARRLQIGDPGGQMRRALDNFPCPALRPKSWRTISFPGANPSDVPFKLTPLPGLIPVRILWR